MRKFIKYSILAALLANSVQVFASSEANLNALLDDVHKRFKQAETVNDKYNIVTQPMNSKYLLGFNGNIQDLDQDELGKSVSRDVTDHPQDGGYDYNTTKINPLAIAILLGCADKLTDFLTVIDDVNSNEVGVWGWRQPYSLAHLAVGPRHPIEIKTVSIIDRLKVIDVLGIKGANFNFKFAYHAGEYCNPPLSAVDTGSSIIRDARQLQARALLYGADPTLTGTSYGGIHELSLPPIYKLAYSYLSEVDKSKVKLTAKVKEGLKQIHSDIGDVLN